MQDFADLLPDLDTEGIESCREHAEMYSAAIFQDWMVLNWLLERFEEPIRKRWMEMSRTTKQAVLLAAWPNMSLKHRPDMTVFKKKKLPSGSKCPDALIWPYINLEDLLQPTSLLTFLNARGRHLPDTFTYSDLEFAPLYKMSDDLVALRKEKFTMAFIGRKDAKNYGALVEWHNTVTMNVSVTAGRTVPVQHGMQILYIQESIMSFLRRCAQKIIEDYDNTTMFEATPRAEPPSLIDDKKTFQTLEVLARDAPYRLPSQMDLHRLQSLASAQKSHAVDHVVALLEDPGYFADAVEDYRNHRIELVLDRHGVLLEHAKDFPLYNRALRQMITDAHCAVFCWTHIDDSISKLMVLFTKYSHQITIEKDLPLELLESLSEMRYFIHRISMDFIENIAAAIRASPPLRKYHWIQIITIQNISIVQWDRIHNFDQNENPTLTRVLDALYSFEDELQRNFFTLHALLDEYERLIHEDPQAKELVTAYLASHVSQLSIMAECLHQFHQFQPWARKVESNIETNEVDFEKRYNILLEKWGEMHLKRRKFEESKLCRLGNPKDGKFYYPADEPRTSETVDRLIAAEAALAKFWKAANANWKRYIGTTPTALVQHIIGERKPQRTSPWVEHADADVSNDARVETTTFLDPFSGHSHDITKQITGVFAKLDVSSKGKKKKTRGVAVSTTEDHASVPQAIISTIKSTPELPVLPVNKRALKVFTSLFHSPDSPNPPGEVAWHDFLHAMISVGFAAVKLQGSAWHFTPRMLDIERPIQFHEPHPVNKLPFTWARRYGRRLSRAFGWSAESFCIA